MQNNKKKTINKNIKSTHKKKTSKCSPKKPTFSKKPKTSRIYKQQELRSSGVYKTKEIFTSAVDMQEKSSSINLFDNLTVTNKKYHEKISRKVKNDNVIQQTLLSLPASYNQTQFVLMVRDPYWVYTYWDLSAEKKNEINLYLKETKKSKSVAIVRVYDITQKDFNRDVGNNFFDIEIPLEVGQWYIYLGLPGHRFIADLGFVDRKNNFYLIAWSNSITLPHDAPSSYVDPLWQPDVKNNGVVMDDFDSITNARYIRTSFRF